MKTVTITVYTARELRELHPEGFERALAGHRRTVYQLDYWTEEIIDSFKACIKAAGLELRDWSIGPYDGSCKIKEFRAQTLSGARALAWLENHLLADLRLPWCPVKSRRTKYGSLYHPGHIKPCPLTGVCFDEDMLQSLRDDLRTGSNLKDAFTNLAHVAGELIGREYDHVQTADYFVEQSDLEGFQFTKTGELSMQ